MLNLGIVAHVDAGKTSLTERLLHAAGVIEHLGSVDAGSTQTDSLALERQRGITIKTAVASFTVGDVLVNLIDTPGHPDFIAEVERALRVLDGAVLVVSAVEGVQAQTRVLLRTLRRLAVPTLLFINKIDRRGAREAELLRDIAARLTPDIVPVSTVTGLGTPAASAHPLDTLDARLVDLAGDGALLADYVHDGPGVIARLRRELARQSRAGAVHPVFFGSAVTGAGVGALMAGLAELLPVAGGDPHGPVSGTVFKVDRDRAGARIAYVRMFSGTLHPRDRLPMGRITAIEGRAQLSAGQIGRLHGLREVCIGDAIGHCRDDGGHLFAPPTLSSVVVPAVAAQRQALHTALTELAEQDPLINLREELTISLYGEVQKEVIEATLLADYGIAVTFRETSTIYVERPAGPGHAGETIGKDGNPYTATLDLLVEPAPPGSGVAFRLEVPDDQVPIYLYRTTADFRAALHATVRSTLAHGLRGWEVTDVRVTATRTGFHAPMTTPGDFRKLIPLVLMDALAAAGTVVCEPIHRFHVDGPAGALGPLLGALTKLGAVPDTQELTGAGCVVGGLVPAARLRSLEQALPGLTHGEGLLESTFAGYRPVTGPPPSRGHWDRKEYLLHVERRIALDS